MGGIAPERANELRGAVLRLARLATRLLPPPRSIRYGQTTSMQTEDDAYRQRQRRGDDASPVALHKVPSADSLDFLNQLSELAAPRTSVAGASAGGGGDTRDVHHEQTVRRGGSGGGEGEAMGAGDVGDEASPVDLDAVFEEGEEAEGGVKGRRPQRQASTSSSSRQQQQRQQTRQVKRIPPETLLSTSTSAGHGGGGGGGGGGGRSPSDQLADAVRPLPCTSTLAHELGITLRPHTAAVGRAAAAAGSGSADTFEARMATLSDGGWRFDTRLGSLAARVASLGDVLSANTGRAAARASPSTTSTAKTATKKGRETEEGVDSVDRVDGGDGVDGVAVVASPREGGESDVDVGGGDGGASSGGGWNTRRRRSVRVASVGASARLGFERHAAAVVTARLRDATAVLRAAAAADDAEDASERAALELGALRRRLNAHQASVRGGGWGGGVGTKIIRRLTELTLSTPSFLPIF